MPIALSEIAAEEHLKCLLMGAPKVWKTTVAVCTAPAPVRVILCESDSALAEAARQGAKADLVRVTGDNAWEQMTQALAEAKEDARAGKIKTVVWDPLSDFADRLCSQSHRMHRSADGKEDGRRAFPHYTSRLLHCLDVALGISAHLIVISHYIDTGPGMDSGVKKRGEGIVPLVPGSVRARIAAKFNDVLWQDIDPADPKKRVFYLSPQGAYGPGCRSLSAKYELLPADFGVLLSTIDEDRAGRGKPTAATAPAGATTATTTNGKHAPARPQARPNPQQRPTQLKQASSIQKPKGR